LKNFRLLGIKGFEDTGFIDIKPITIIIGKNSSGKSSILRFPLVLRQTFLDAAMAPLLFYGKSIDYGNYEDVIFNHDKSKPIEFYITIDSSELQNIRGPGFFKENFKNNNQLTIRVVISQDNKTLKVNEFSVSNEKQELLSCKQADNTIIIESGGKKYNASHGELVFNKFIPDFRMFRVLDNKHKNIDMEQVYDILFALDYYFNLMANTIFYIGPFRKTPERFYRYTENAVQYVGSDGEFAPAILGQDLRTNGNLLRTVSDWLEKNLNFSLSVEELRGDLFKILVKDRETNAQNNLIDVGHGLSQLIPIVVQTFMRNNHYLNRNHRERFLEKLNIIEQPELHLHPAAQASLANLFVEAIKSNSNNCFLIETHSEHLLLRLRRYIVEEYISPNDVAIYYTEKVPNYSGLKVHKLEIDLDGKINGWPEGFFSDDYHEVLELQKAVNKRIKKSGGPSLW